MHYFSFRMQKKYVNTSKAKQKSNNTLITHLNILKVIIIHSISITVKLNLHIKCIAKLINIVINKYIRNRTKRIKMKYYIAWKPWKYFLKF